jgi:hypothetical protein
MASRTKPHLFELDARQRGQLVDLILSARAKGDDRESIDIAVAKKCKAFAKVLSIRKESVLATMTWREREEAQKGCAHALTRSKAAKPDEVVTMAEPETARARAERFTDLLHRRLDEAGYKFSPERLAASREKVSALFEGLKPRVKQPIAENSDLEPRHKPRSALRLVAVDGASV